MSCYRSFTSLVKIKWDFIPFFFFYHCVEIPFTKITSNVVFLDNPRFTFINEFLIGQGIDLMGELASSAEYLKSIMGEHSEILS